MNIQFKEYSCTLTSGRYSNGRIALKLIDANDGLPVATATVNIIEAPLNPGEIIIKDYSENDGMWLTLFKAGIVSEPLRYVNSGWVRCPVCMLLFKP